MQRHCVDLCVIGAGSGGLSVAAAATQMGASTVLIEKGRMGGDCLNYGCVPSKSLLASAHAAMEARAASRFGVDCGEPKIDDARVYAHIRSVIGAIAPNDSQERFEGLGATVIRAPARFIGRGEVEAGDHRIMARRFVIATGSSPMVPPIPGLAGIPFETNETIFERRNLPRHLIVIGGGPIGMEMAQAHRGLGTEVTVLQKGKILPKDDPEMTAILRDLLAGDGIRIIEDADVLGVEKTASGAAAKVRANGKEERIEGTDVLVSAGRKPTIDDLGLEAAGIDYTPKGVTVDARLRTTNKKVFAIGDAAGPYQFTHMAGYHAGIVIRNALLRLPAKVDYRAVPWVTYTAPELAHVGLSEQDARAQGHAIRVLRWSFHENDRAQAEGATDGLVKVIATPRGRVLGATVLGAHAGELIQTWSLAIKEKLKVSAIAGMIAPYPTLGEVNKRAAASFYAAAIFSPMVRRLVRFLSHFG
ncbi:MAG TPA: FAD-dependent oxidoreductase [Alphaproteobacteria bacterium]|jgi:pyruvate/2-oxoglutarate dehydrogenase complex dihydrolipoamide dehydrogenase (E3) component|nr:FAD-dependent oxidoreductase [Alphaproteobacteria bacterium]